MNQGKTKFCLSLQVSALITGVHRAYPFAVVDSDVMNTQVETMYKIAHLSTFNIAIHAFMLLFQVMIFIFVFVFNF